MAQWVKNPTVSSRMWDSLTAEPQQELQSPQFSNLFAISKGNPLGLPCWFRGSGIPVLSFPWLRFSPWRRSVLMLAENKSKSKKSKP